MKADSHQRVIYIYIKFHEILFSSYLDIAQNGQTDIVIFVYLCVFFHYKK